MSTAYLERIAALLSGRDFGDGDVQRAAAPAQRELIGSGQYVIFLTVCQRKAA